ncbi:universal stress protein [Aliiroseovarius sp. KMU-50]|uniref:Universal stress protein n=1 Tax=Aliiroseovarius salicola TaxID=3009082 RepID=A0ABT4W415_9RHOB|nr:universal stress protein [Aliiroseovarius sp. KMU-50]MDA5095226.1 universal stress protein [Aliiroseovarius sp. KMU-50]
MTKSVLVPVDLAHTDALEAAISAVRVVAAPERAKVTLVGVTGSVPSAAAHNPTEFSEKLAAYGSEVAARIGLPVDTQTLVDVDVEADLGRVLIKAAEDLGADLIVMASHVPGFIEHIIASNAGYVASHAKCSVYVVR